VFFLHSENPLGLNVDDIGENTKRNASKHSVSFFSISLFLLILANVCGGILTEEFRSSTLLPVVKNIRVTTNLISTEIASFLKKRPLYLTRGSILLSKRFGDPLFILSHILAILR
jgi:hypothetical protein